jgi:phenylacetate-CoA ligase
MQALAAERFGPEAVFECEYVERIPQEPSGKYRFCISRVQNPFTRPQEVAWS